MKIFGTCYSPFTDRWTPELWKALYAAGLNWVRLSVELFRLCPTSDPATWRLGELDACIAAIRAAGLKIYLNPGGCPAWASEGQAAYEDGLVSDSWWNAPNAKTADGRPDQFPHGLHDFDQNPNRTDSVTDPVTGRVITGLELAAIDMEQPPRPWRTKPPHRDPYFYRTIFTLLAKRYGKDVAAWGVENEPGAYTNPVMRNYDIAFGGTEDTITTRFFREIVIPALSAVLDVDPNAWTIGIDADSDAIMERCCAAEWAVRLTGARRALYTHGLGAHPYGGIRRNVDYQTPDAFDAVFDKWALGRARWCSEIGGTAEEVLGFVRTYSDRYPAIFMMPWTIFLGPLGPQFSAEFAAINGPVKPPATGRPMGRGR